MHSNIRKVARKLVVGGTIAAATLSFSSLAVGQVWNPVKQKMLNGAPVVAKRVDTSEPDIAAAAAQYCGIASQNNADFTWTDMVSSGLEFTYTWAMWAGACPTAVAKVVGAEVFYSKRVNFIDKAYFDKPGPQSEELTVKEVQRAVDGGALVVIINVDNVQQARQVVKRVYYPPMGERHLGPGQYDVVYPANVTGGNYVASFNDNVVVIATISTIEGVSQARAIAGVPGIHALFMDTMNLESEAGYAQGTSEFDRLARAVRSAAQGKYLCTANRSGAPQTLSCSKA